jgi:hypothetical protein
VRTTIETTIQVFRFGIPAAWPATPTVELITSPAPLTMGWPVRPPERTWEVAPVPKAVDPSTSLAIFEANPAGIPPSLPTLVDWGLALPGAGLEKAEHY